MMNAHPQLVVAPSRGQQNRRQWSPNGEGSTYLIETLYMKPTLLVLLAVVVMSTSTHAQPDRRKSLDQAVSGGTRSLRRLRLSAETDRRGDRESYNIRILTRDG